MAKPTSARDRPVTRDPEATRDAILSAATDEFAQHGLAGARVDRIAERAGINKRMLYYYFGQKEGLFLAVLEGAYQRIREEERQLNLTQVEPTEAIRRLVAFTWNYYIAHPEFITLLNTENLHKGRHISRSLRATEYSSPAVGLIDSVLASGVRKSVFRGDLRARDVYLMIVGMCYFYLSNRHTLSVFLGEELEASSELARWESFIADSVLRVVSPAVTSRESTPAFLAGADR